MDNADSHHQTWMRQCFELARKGAGSVAPNPMVGALLVYENQILGSGYHQKYGQSHAEVLAIQSVEKQELLKHSTLYVSLEPCCHYGKTPPCSDLILNSHIPRVVFSSLDINPKVAGGGALRLKNGAVSVTGGVLAEEGIRLNKFFYTYHYYHRPYIILKWAQSADQFIAPLQSSRFMISCQQSQLAVHQLRAECGAIMVGYRTALQDDPQLTVRLVTGANPLRVVIDRDLSLPSQLRLRDGTTPTLIFSHQLPPASDSSFSPINYCKLQPETPEIEHVLQTLHQKRILSLLVEGGTSLLQKFIRANLWDEIQIFQSPNTLGQGILTPQLDLTAAQQLRSGEDQLLIYENQHLSQMIETITCQTEKSI